MKATLMKTRPMLVGILTTLAGCSVGPTYVTPQTPAIALVSPQADALAANPSQVPADWWSLFQDEGLNRWIEAALMHNHDIAQAQANLLAARAIVDERRLDGLPGVTSRAAYTRGIYQQLDSDGLPARSTSESMRAGLDVQWEIDLFGRLNRLQEAATARAQASHAELALVRLSIAGEVARNWFEAQGYRRQIEVAQQEVTNWRDTVRLAEAVARAGAGLPEDVENARANLLQSEARLPPLKAGLQQSRYRLDVLAGLRAGEGGLPGFDAVSATPLVSQLPLGDVDRLIRDRPDVRQAERLLAASVEDIGAATAELYPRLSLGGFLGFFALRDADFGSAGARAFEIAPTLSWPALRLGNVRARIRGTEALADGARARYVQALLTAQEEVEGAVTQLVEHQHQLTALVQSGRHAQSAFDISSRRYRAGSGSYQAVLENQRTLFQLRQQVVQVEVSANVQVVLLYKALGVI